MMRIKRRGITRMFRGLVTAIFFLWMGYAHGYCFEPSAPSKPWGSAPMKPIVPYCVNEWDNTHTCDDWQINQYMQEVDSYNSEIQDWVNKLHRYASEAEEYYGEVIDYVNCEMRALQ